MAHDKHSVRIEDAMTLYGLRGRARACAGVALVLALMGAPTVAQEGSPPAASPPAVDPAPTTPRLARWTAELDEVVIRPRRQPPDLPERRAVPQGLGGLIWAATRPTQAWRLLVPDPNASPVPPRSADDPREPPGAYRSRIGEPGRIF
jgi:hypothetical protein